MHSTPTASALTLAAPFLLVALLAASPPLSAQDGGLEGRDLNPVSETGDAIANKIVDLLSSQPEGEIRRVTVLEERQKSLRLEVEYAGFAGNWLKAKVQQDDDGLDDVPEITSEPVELDGSGTAELVLELSDEAGEGFEVESDRLALVVAENARKRTGARRSFFLQKRWANAVRAENVVVTVHDRMLTSTATGYQQPPPQNERFIPGARDQEVEFEYRFFRTDGGRFLSARNGGGGDVVIRRTSSPGRGETFEIGWLDRDQDLARVRTSDGWHLLAVRDDGSVDARSIDPADPATVLQLDYRGDGAYVMYQAPSTAAARFADDAQSGRGRVFTAALGATTSSRLPSVRLPRSIRPGRNSVVGARSRETGSRLAVHHDGGVSARRFSESAVRDYFFRARSAPAPEGAGELRLGETDGPGERTIDLASVLHTPAYTSTRAAEEGPMVPEMLGVNRLVWLDRNETSGVYYFLPSAYHLKWDADRERYALDVEYLSAAGAAEPQALVQATLTPRVGYRERRAVEIMVRQAALGYGLPFVELRPMDIDTDATTDRVAEQLSREHGADSVWVAHPSEVLGEVRMGWRMPQARLDNLVEILRSGQGVQPTLHVRPRGREGGAEIINLNLSWQDPQTYPGIAWENSSYWRNAYPHPVRLKSLQALVLDRQDRVMMLSWDLSGTDTIPPRARAGMGNPLTQPVIENAFFTWVEYDVLPTDETTEATVRSLMGGVSESLERSLEVVLLDAISGTGAERLQLFVRSPYLRPDGQARDLEVLSFDADGQTKVVPLYLGRADAEVPYEWTAILYLPNGETVPDEGFGDFVEGDRSLQLFLSSTSLREAVGEIPGSAGGE